MGYPNPDNSRNITRPLARRTNLFVGAQTVNPLIIFLAAAPLHVADTGAGNLFITIALRTNLIGIIGHNHTSITHQRTDFTCPLEITNSFMLIKYARKITASRL